MRFSVRCSALIAGLVGLAACQPLPRPFGREPDARPNPLLGLADARGITVVGIDGAPDAMAGALNRAVAAALLARNIPTSTSSANRHGYFLVGTAESEPAGGARVHVRLRWEVLDGQGRVKGTHRQRMTLPETIWREGSVDQAREIAGLAAPRIAAIVQHPAPEAAARPPARRLFVAPVTGGPEAGNRALGRAIARALGAAGYEVVTARRPDDLAIAGTVNIGAPVGGRRTVEIVWSVLDGKNVTLGTVAQRNAVATATLRDGWRGLAPDIARNAIDGVRDLLRRLSARTPKSTTKTVR